MTHTEKEVFKLCDSIGETCNSKFQITIEENRPDKKCYRFYGLGGCVDIEKEELVYDEDRLPHDPKWEYLFYAWPEDEDGFKELSEDEVYKALIQQG